MAVASQSKVPELPAHPQLLSRRLDAMPDPERAFAALYGTSPNAFWLDSSAAGGERGRFSFIGDSAGPLAALVTYDVDTAALRIERGGEVETRRESIFEYIDRELRRLADLDADLPFDFLCGFAGYLGYELKADCGATAAHQATTPDAAFIFADRLIAFDHEQGHAYLLALTPSPSELHQILGLAGREFDAVRSAEEWMEEMGERLEGLPPLDEPLVEDAAVELRLRRSSEQYGQDIAACKRYLAAGHSYEICLTNRLESETAVDSLELYRALRQANPAPFAAYLRFGDLAVLSSSPERFLAVDRRRQVEARPIKGTSARGDTADEDARLAEALCRDEKSRAENVTIVDLLRNDLGKVCELGTIRVPELIRVETYETVHQLVSSVRGRLRDGVGVAECVRACFPPGSMTGAPKLRTMEILDELEGEARGVYSGAIGYFGIGGGCDLSVAIRTIVLQGAQATIGAGGAIVVQSDAEQELAEMLLKAAASAAALVPGASISSASLAARKPRWRGRPSPTPS
ncbi:MAG TPA: aminodeoxychorismate synthase component I [Solirubrobacterales bacterium]|nr:aminodeoxychorismate synthase component I [Solirubrobacterales bacterium]